MQLPYIAFYEKNEAKIQKTKRNIFLGMIIQTLCRMFHQNRSKTLGEDSFLRKHSKGPFSGNYYSLHTLNIYIYFFIFFCQSIIRKDYFTPIFMFAQKLNFLIKKNGKMQNLHFLTFFWHIQSFCEKLRPCMNMNIGAKQLDGVVNKISSRTSKSVKNYDSGVKSP